MFYSTKGAGLPFKAATALPATVESIWRDCFPAKGRKSGSWGKQRWREGRKKDGLVPKECVNVTSTWFPPKVKEQLPGYLLLTYICFVKFQQNAMTTMRKWKWRRESCCKLDLSYFSGWRQQPCISRKETRLWRAPSYIHFSPPPHPPSSLHRASPRRGSSYIHDSGCVSALLPLRPCLHLMSSTIPPFSIGGSCRVFGREEDEKTWFIHQFQDVGHRSRVTPPPPRPIASHYLNGRYCTSSASAGARPELIMWTLVVVVCPHCDLPWRRERSEPSARKACTWRALLPCQAW